MKKRFKVIIAVLLALSLSAFVLAACSGDTNADKIDSSELGGYDYSQEAAFGEVPLTKTSVSTAFLTRTFGKILITCAIPIRQEKA